MEILSQIRLAGIVPVIKVKRAEDAVPICSALERGGLPLAEITFRTDAAAESIRRVRDALPNVLVGAGTVVAPDQVDAAAAAGARFIVTPGLNAEVVRRCQALDLPVVPGCATASEVNTALSLGLNTVKFFPAEASGGIKTLKALAAPFGGVSFLPTGGVNLDNLNEYLACPAVAACGGTWLVKDELVDAGAFDRIEQLAREAVSAMLGFTLAHIGINGESEAEAERVSRQFETLFGWTRKPGGGADFASTYVEAMKTPGRGQKGHIAIGCRSLPRARAYLEGRGFVFDPASEKCKNGKPVALYLAEEIAGFAIHLLQQ